MPLILHPPRLVFTKVNWGPQVCQNLTINLNLKLTLPFSCISDGVCHEWDGTGLEEMKGNERSS